jgi:hypothetical protein
MSIVQTILIASGVVGVLALLLYFVPVSKVRVPAIALGAVAGVGVGAAIGMAATLFYGDTVLAEYRGRGVDMASSKGAGASRKGADPSAKAPLASAGAPQGKGGGNGRASAPDPKAQLAQLITKLDLLASKSLVLDLTSDQKQKIQEKLAGLDEESDLSTDGAKARLDGLLEIVEGQRTTLEAAGYRWPGAGGGGRGGPGGGGGGGMMGNAQPPRGPSNPFKDGANNQHLKSLRAATAPGETKSKD